MGGGGSSTDTSSLNTPRFSPPPPPQRPPTLGQSFGAIMNLPVSKAVNALNIGPWQSAVRNAPIQGGPGTSPGLPEFHGATPKRSMGTGSSGPGVHQGMTGVATPADNGSAGRSPHIIDRIPDQPPIVRQGAQPIPTDVRGGRAMPISQQYLPSRYGLQSDAPIPPSRPQTPFPPQRPTTPFPPERPQGLGNATPFPPFRPDTPIPPSRPMQSGRSAADRNPFSSANTGQPYSYEMAKSLIASKLGPDAVRKFATEGLHPGPYAVGDQGSSFGPFQAHRGGIAPGVNTRPGLGDDMAKAGIDVRDPASFPAQVDYLKAHPGLMNSKVFHGFRNISGDVGDIGGQGSNPSPYAPKSQITPENHPSRYGGAMMVGGQQFQFVTGGAGRGSSPPGDHLITGYRGDGIFARRGGSFLVQDVFDPKVGDTRTAVEIHDAAHGATAGCFGIPHEQWPQARQAILDTLKANGGQAILRVDGNGNSSIVPVGTPPGPIQVRDRLNLASSDKGSTPAQMPGQMTPQNRSPSTEQAKKDSVAKRIGKALQQNAKNAPKPEKPSEPKGGGDDPSLSSLGSMVEQGGQSAQQQLAQAVQQQSERSSHLLDAPQIQSPDQLASLKPGQVFRSPDGKLRWYTPQVGPSGGDNA